MNLPEDQGTGSLRDVLGLLLHRYCRCVRPATVVPVGLEQRSKEQKKEKQNNIYIFGRLIIQVLAIDFWKKDTLKHTV